MRKSEFYRLFENNSSIEGLGKDLNLNIGNNINVAELENEIFKLINLKNMFYINREGVMLFSINDYLLTFNNEFDYFKKLLDCSQKYNKRYFGYFISYFICEYHFSIESEAYKDRKDIRAAFYNSFSRKQFYNEDSDIKSAAIKHINNVIDSEEKLSLYRISKYIPLLNSFHNKESKRIMNRLLRNEKMIISCSHFDTDFIKHKNIYNRYLLNNNESIYSYIYEDIIKLSLKLDKSKALKRETAKKIVNQIIDEVNALISKKNERGVIIEIANIDAIITISNKIREQATKAFIEFSDKLKECIETCLRYKRKMLKTADEKDMFHSFDSEYETPSSDIRRIKKEFEVDFIKLYSYLAKDFEKELMNAIENYKNHPISFMVSKTSIYTDLGIYKRESEEKKNAFKEYYDEMGKGIFDSYDDKTDICHLNGEYYGQMIKNTRMSDTVVGQFIYLVLGEGVKERLISYCKEMLGHEDDSNDPYLTNILLICSIDELLNRIAIKKKIINVNKKCGGSEIIENIFSDFVTNGYSKLQINGVMNVYYYVYYENGVNYRNNYVHGNKFSKDENLYVDMMYLIAMNVFLGYIYEQI